MIYSSYDFLLLLPAILVWFYCARSATTQRVVVLFVSMGFLAWAGLWNLLVVAALIAVVFVYFKLEQYIQLGKAGLGVVIALLVANLAYFKYRHFLSSSFGLDLPTVTMIAWVVPLGISFYTFEAISAVIDLRRRRQIVGPLDWSLFMMFFPHLIAGPIVRFRQLAPQFSGLKLFKLRNLTVGMHLFTLGFLKKLAADPIGQIIDPVWGEPSDASGITLLLALLGFYVQLYADFSGYTDMGRGIARMLGFRLPLNFRAPFLAASPAEFYQRWHVSLSSWIRTFVYDTLSISVLRRVRSRKLQNYALFAVILSVMAVFGLWHGAAWHFILFGVAQGLVIAGWQIVTSGKPPRTNLGWIFSVLVLQVTWLASLVLFRADSVTAAGAFFAGLLQGGPLADPRLLWCLVALAVALLVQVVDYCVRQRFIARALIALRRPGLGAVAVALLFVTALTVRMAVDNNRLAAQAAGTALPTAGFIYFRF